MPRIRQATGNNVTDAALRANLDGVPRRVFAPLPDGRVDITVAAGEEFTVQHSLGEIPDTFGWNSITPNALFLSATDSAREKWNETQIVLVASGTGTAILWVEKF